MNPSRLYKKLPEGMSPDPAQTDGCMVPVNAWFCGKCGRVWGIEDQAERCCLCYYCGKPVEDLKAGYAIREGLGISHKECQDKHWNDAAEKRWNKIPVVDPKDLLPEDEFVFISEERAEEWHEAIDIILDNCFDSGVDPPEFVEVGKKDPFPRLDLVDYALTTANDFCEDGGDHLQGLDELDAASKDFAEANEGFYRYESSNKRVRLRDLMRYIGYDETR